MILKNLTTFHMPFLLCFLFMILNTVVTAQDSAGYDSATKERWQKMLDQAKLIDEELTQTGLPDWAGFYHWGSLGYVGATLKIAPISGFVYRRYTDIPSKERPESFDFGKFEVVNGAIRLHSILDNLKNKDFFPVKWGKRTLLVPEDEILKLAVQYNTGCADSTEFSEVGHLYFPTKADTLRRKLFGKPSIPSKYELYLFSEPVTAKLVSIIQNRLKKAPSTTNHGRYEQYTTVKLNVGSKHGLLKGMYLYSPIASTENLYLTAEITALDENTAEAEIYRSIQGKKPILPKIGLEFSSRLSESILNDRITPWQCK